MTEKTVAKSQSGITLADYLVQGKRPLSEKDCIERMLPLIRALGKERAGGNASLQICPENILVHPDGTMMLRGTDAAGDLGSDYRAIEQYDSNAASGPWTDVYAMCGTLYYCVTGKNPPTPIARMRGEELDLSGFSPAVADVLGKGLAIWAEGRIQSLGELADSLQGDISAEGATVLGNTAMKTIPGMTLLEESDADRTVFRTDPREDGRTALHVQQDAGEKTAFWSERETPVERHEVQRQFEIGASAPSKETAKDVAETPRTDTPESDTGPKRKKARKTVVPLSVLAAVALVSFFTLRNRWDDIVIRDRPSSTPTQIHQTEQPEATAQAQQPVESAPALDTRELVPDAEDVGDESPEAETTHAETKPLVPEETSSASQFVMPTEGILTGPIDSTDTAPDDQSVAASQETQTVAVSEVGGNTDVQTADDPQPEADHTIAQTQTQRVQSVEEDETYGNLPADGEKEAAPAVSDKETSAKADVRDVDVTVYPAPVSTKDIADMVSAPSPESQTDAPTTQPGMTEDGLVALTGKYGDVEGVRGAANPYYLDQPVVGCDHVRMDLSFEQIGGYGFGPFYLYVKDLDGNWHHVAVFRIEKEQEDGRTVTYELDLDGLESFVAIAICPAENGMDFTRIYDFTIYVKPECVSEYGTKIPRPSFMPARSERPVSFTRFDTRPFPSDDNSDNPFGDFNLGDLDLGDVFGELAGFDYGKSEAAYYDDFAGEKYE